MLIKNDYIVQTTNKKNLTIREVVFVGAKGFEPLTPWV